MNFFERLHYIVKVLNYIVGGDFNEVTLREGPWATIEIVDNVGARRRSEVQIDGAREVLETGTKIESIK